MTDAGLVLATWTQGYTVVLPDKTVVEPGSQHLIGVDEAKDSDHWQPVKGTKTAEKPAAAEEN